MIQLTSVSHSYTNHQVLDNMNLTLNRGETLVLSGKSGVGKTTLARLIIGLETPTSGKIEIDGLDMHPGHSMVPPHKRPVAMVFQQPALWPHMTVRAHLEFVSKGGIFQGKQEINQILKKTGLESLASRRPHQLSEGQARRVAIARALASAPRYLILDEPLVNLDPQAKLELLDLTQKMLLSLGAGLLFISHDENEASLPDGRRYWLEQGKIREIKAQSQV